MNSHYHRKTKQIIFSDRAKLSSSLNNGLLTAGVHSQDPLNGRIGHWVPSRVRDQGDEVPEGFDQLDIFTFFGNFIQGRFNFLIAGLAVD